MSILETSCCLIDVENSALQLKWMLTCPTLTSPSHTESCRRQTQVNRQKHGFKYKSQQFRLDTQTVRQMFLHSFHIVEAPTQHFHIYFFLKLKFFNRVINSGSDNLDVFFFLLVWWLWTSFPVGFFYFYFFNQSVKQKLNSQVFVSFIFQWVT